MRSAVSTAVRSVTETNSTGTADGSAVTVGDGDAGAVVVGAANVGVGLVGWLVEDAIDEGAD